MGDSHPVHDLVEALVTQAVGAVKRGAMHDGDAIKAMTFAVAKVAASATPEDRDQMRADVHSMLDAAMDAYAEAYDRMA